MFPMPWKLAHQARKAGAKLCPMTTAAKVQATPAMKLFHCGFSDGR